jgi:acyl carrier protein
MAVNVNSELIEKVQSVLAEALQLPLEQVTPELAFGDLPQWDSMGHMEVMMRLEEHFGVEVNADTIAELISIPTIIAYLRNNRES